MAKYLKDFLLTENRRLSPLYSLLKLRPADGALPPVSPGQFAQVEVKNSKTTFLRRPISINYVDAAKRELWLLVRKAGPGTSALASSPEGSTINILLPLGNGFSLSGGRHLLVGGGVGVAPLLFLAKELSERGARVSLLLGARSQADLLELEQFKAYGNLHLATEDGSMGVKGLVTAHPALGERFDIVQCCGPLPMMKAVAQAAASAGSECEVSLENLMACGMGACLCCVEDTTDAGNVCVCTQGPVFNTKRLKWDITKK